MPRFGVVAERGAWGGVPSVGADPMRGPAPKPASQRQRRNKASTATTLPSAAESARNEVPDLPTRPEGWHPMVREWWEDVWRSPMASEYLAADKHGLYRLAFLQQDFWEADSRTARQAASAEIRTMSQQFGLTPIDRRRLQWEIEKGDAAEERTTTRRARKATGPVKDPRSLLRVS